MSVGTSTGENFNDDISFRTGNFGSENSYHNENSQNDVPVSYDHHVPLVASAVMGDDGSMQGMVVDHRLKGKISPDDEELLKLHEGTELPYMNDLVHNGMSPPEAYAEAHKWATARETAASIAKWGEDGHEAYKERMRDNAAIAREPSERDRHPDAHTTVYGLDESEIGYKAAEGGPEMHNQPLQIDPMEKSGEGAGPMSNAARVKAYKDRLKGKSDEELPPSMQREYKNNYSANYMRNRRAQQKKLELEKQDRDPDLENYESIFDKPKRKLIPYAGKEAMEGAEDAPLHGPLEVDPLQGKAPSTGGFKLNRISESDPSPRGTYQQEYHLHEGDEPKGVLRFTKNYHGEQGHAHLEWAGGLNEYGGDRYSINDLGPSAVRSAFREYIKQNPDVNRISAFRVSGTRGAEHGGKNIDFDVVNGKLRLRDESKYDEQGRTKGVGRRSPQQEINTYLSGGRITREGQPLREESRDIGAQALFDLEEEMRRLNPTPRSDDDDLGQRLHDMSDFEFNGYRAETNRWERHLWDEYRRSSPETHDAARAEWRRYYEQTHQPVAAEFIRRRSSP